MPIHCICMEFYLRTGFRESQTYVDGKEHKKQGGCQGNGASPATWQQSSALMIRAQHRHGHGITIQSPISRHSIRQVGGGSSWWMTPTSGGNDGCIFSKSVGSTPGIEPGTSSTLKTNHTPRPSGQLKFSKKWIDCSTFLCSINTMIKIRAAPTPQQLLLWLYLPTKIHPTFFQPSFLIHYSSSILFEGYGMDPSSF